MASTSRNDYVYVEMIRDQGGDKYEVVAGLFKGLLVDDGSKYILLNGLKGSTEVLLIGKEGFDFLSIEVLEADFRNMTYLTNQDSDQEAALKIMEALFDELKEDGLEEKTGSGIIDVSKYNHVPKDYLDGKPIDAGTTASRGTGVGSFSNRSTHYKTTTGTHYTTHQPKPKPVPTAFKRTKTSKPGATVLEELSALMDAISNGDTVLPLPETPGDDPDDNLDACATEGADHVYGDNWY